jgi:ATP-dependent DNA ligase
LFSRDWKDYTPKFPEIVEELKRWVKGDDWVIDGELCYFNPDDGNDIFTPSQRRSATEDPMKRIVVSPKDVENWGVKQPVGAFLPISQVYPIVLMVFDVMELNGQVITNRTYMERKQILKRMLEGEKSKHIDYVGFWEEGKREKFKEMEALSKEGIMLKRKISPYTEGRSTYWQKKKTRKTDEAIVVGISKGTGVRAATFGAVILAQYDGNKLVYVGKSSGFDNQELDDFYREIMAMPDAKCPFDYKRCNEVDAIKFVEPKIVVEIEYFEKSTDGIYRFPAFKNRRFDKTPRECKFLPE